ncbi:MAG: hypothetical protein R3C62_16430 [Chloroflexota bacterium]
MREQTNHTYAAVITISLPGADRMARASVLLTPADEVEQNGRYKPLPDCTLADLQQFGDQWESDVWETYQTIRLIDLHSDETVQVQVALVNEQGPRLEPEALWEKTAVLLEPTPETTAAMDEADDEDEAETLAQLLDDDTAAPETNDEAAFVTEPVEELAEKVMEDEGEESEEETAVSPPTQPTGSGTVADSVSDTIIIPAYHDRIIVSEPEPVFKEVESRDQEARQLGQKTLITESQARVRVAGQQLPLGHRTWAAVDILIDEPALRASQAHALSSLSREVAGVLVGPRPEKQPDGRYAVHIIDTIVAKYTVMQGASVTYTPESWRYLNDTLGERYPNEEAVMVGWYHTHPGFGIFLSGMDLFIHQNFFTQIWHVALVLDPRARTSGFFCWDRRQQRVSRYDFAWPYWAAGSW